MLYIRFFPVIEFDYRQETDFVILQYLISTVNLRKLKWYGRIFRQKKTQTEGKNSQGTSSLGLENLSQRFDTQPRNLEGAGHIFNCAMSLV